MTESKARVILNPAAGAWRTKDRLVEISSAMHEHFPESYSIAITTGRLDATHKTRQAIKEGNRLIVAVGGDGTLNEVINGFFENGKLIDPACQLGIIESGSGGDFVKNMGLPPTLEGQVKALSSPKTRSLDILTMEYTSLEGEKMLRYCINECESGLGGVVAMSFEKYYKNLGGKFGFMLATLLHGIPQPNKEIVLTVETPTGTEVINEKMLGAIMANGASIGGGMIIAPQAQVDDGLINLVIIKEQSIPQRVLSFSKVYSGAHLATKWFRHILCTSITLDSPEKVLFEADGEFLGQLPCKVGITKGLIKGRLL